MLVVDGDHAGPRALRGAPVNGGFGSDRPGFGKHCGHRRFKLGENEHSCEKIYVGAGVAVASIVVILLRSF